MFGGTINGRAFNKRALSISGLPEMGNPACVVT